MSNIILLHGAIGSKKEMEAIENELTKQNHSVFNLNFPGHGSEAESDQLFSIEYFAESVRKTIDALDEVYIIGYSLGGYVALCLCEWYPEKIKGVATFGTIFNWSPEQSDKQIAQIQPEKLKEKVPAFADYLQNIHSDKWEKVLTNTHNLLKALGQNPLLNEERLTSIHQKVLITQGDKDALVDLEASIMVYRKLKNANFCVYPKTGHPILKLNTIRFVEDFNTMILK